jgi:hypothetical protein
MFSCNADGANTVVQERLKKNAKKPKQLNAAGEAFTVTLLAPKQNFPRPLEACECRWGREEREFMRRKFRVYIYDILLHAFASAPT